ncbi:hypothetical protein E3N88_06474 [Mikania micrantha]|uniref:Uncharacterized protein n=1 Tax=Mikania micrantha TaxID=192012 RepID=A0A5N6PNW0_9ASTR|nr:hypothetical protein E3N88_06474 [Mikania micrantha]
MLSGKVIYTDDKMSLGTIVERHVQQDACYQKGPDCATGHVDHVVEGVTVCLRAPRATMNLVLATLS